MDISEFIDQDIIVFLDEKVDEQESLQRPAGPVSTLYLTRDYEKELTVALQRHDIVQAKLVLHALKDEFDGCPDGTPDKEQLKTLLLTLYERLKDHLDAQHISAASAFVAKSQKEEAPKIEQPSFDFTPVYAGIREAEAALQKQDVKSAVQQYRQIKHNVAGASSVPAEIATRLFSLHGEIKQAIADRTRDPGEELDKQLLLQLEQEKRTLDTALRTGNLRGALQEYKQMRVITQQIKNKELAAKTIEKMQRIHRLLETLKTSSIHNEQQLGQAIP